jgi:glycine/D-amino acid oxidase-like deaminating enzyme
MVMSSYDVAIIGAGIVGCSAAWVLNRRGLRVAVLEKGRVGGEQSSRNAGFIRQQGRDLREIPMARRALALWREISAESRPISASATMASSLPHPMPYSLKRCAAGQPLPRNPGSTRG